MSEVSRRVAHMSVRYQLEWIEHDLRRAVAKGLPEPNQKTARGSSGEPCRVLQQGDHAGIVQCLVETGRACFNIAISVSVCSVRLGPHSATWSLSIAALSEALSRSGATALIRPGGPWTLHADPHGRPDRDPIYSIDKRNAR